MNTDEYLEKIQFGNMLTEMERRRITGDVTRKLAKCAAGVEIDYPGAIVLFGACVPGTDGPALLRSESGYRDLENLALALLERVIDSADKPRDFDRMLREIVGMMEQSELALDRCESPADAWSMIDATLGYLASHKEERDRKRRELAGMDEL